MFLKTLTLKNFAIHKKQVINFTPGLNAICGETNEGKSAIIRALYLILHNAYRNPAKLFNHYFKPKNKFFIKLEDFNGNVITRENKLYTLNGTEFKAFKTDVPRPIVEVFPFTEINWQRQLDRHFLILNTGGATSKFLQKYIGMGDQAELLAEAKRRISENKSELKRQNENANEYKETINSLKPVKKYIKIAKSLKEQEDTLNEYDENIEIISDYLEEYEKIQNQINRYKNISQFLDNFKNIKEEFNSINELNLQIENISENIEQYLELEEIDISKFQKILARCSAVLEEKSQLNEINSQINSILNTLNNIETKEEIIINCNKRTESLRNELKKEIKKLNLCPFCKEPINPERLYEHFNHQ